MDSMQQNPVYRVWGADKVAYGPLALATLTEWIKEKRITDKSWVLLENDNQWQKVTDLPELRPLFPSKAITGGASRSLPASGQHGFTSAW
jgi:hypothetical protein